MFAVGGKLPFDEYGCVVRSLAGLVLFSGALAAAACKPPPKQPEDSASTYRADRCGREPSTWSPQGHEFGELMQRNALEIGPSGLKWNGSSISMATLRRYLQSVNQLNPPINLQIAIDPSTDCGKVNQTRALITESFHCAAGSIPVCVEYSEPEWQRLRTRRRSMQLPE
jgi:hypothetical protein